MKSKYKIRDMQSLEDAQAKLRLDIQEDWDRLKDLGIRGVSQKFVKDDLLPDYNNLESHDWRKSVCQILLDFGYNQLSSWLLSPSSDHKNQWKNNVRQILDVLYQQNRKDLAEMVYQYIYEFIEKKIDD